MKAFQPSPDNTKVQEIFERVKEKYKQELKNKALTDPYRQAMSKMEQVLKTKAHEAQDKLNLLTTGFSFTRFTELNSAWLHAGRPIWFFSGNLSPSEAQEITASVRSLLDLKTLSLELVPEVPLLKLPAGATLVYE